MPVASPCLLQKEVKKQRSQGERNGREEEVGGHGDGLLGGDLAEARPAGLDAERAVGVPVMAEGLSPPPLLASTKLSGLGLHAVG